MLKKRGTIARRPPPGHFEPRSPQTAAQFAESFAAGGNQYLGRQVISGLECEGYILTTADGTEAIPTWFAPSLNFMVVKAVIRPAPDQEHIMILDKIRVGEEPDPKLFQIPDGFVVE